MKARIILIALVLVIAASPSWPVDNDLGLGIIIGEPTGVSLKKWMNSREAIDAAAAWSFSEEEAFELHADYLVHNFSVLGSTDLGKRSLPVYMGIGGRIRFKDEGHGRDRDDEEAAIGVRVPFGLSYLFQDALFDIFIEIVPILDIAPDTDFDLSAALGARYYFR